MQWLCDVCQPLRATTHDRLRARMLQAYLRAEAIMAAGGKWLTAAEQAALAAAAEEALELNNALAARSLARGRHVYKLLPKHHVRALALGLSRVPRRSPLARRLVRYMCARASMRRPIASVSCGCCSVCELVRLCFHRCGCVCVFACRRP